MTTEVEFWVEWAAKRDAFIAAKEAGAADLTERRAEMSAMRTRYRLIREFLQGGGVPEGVTAPDPVTTGVDIHGPEEG
jgi:hypothetical protein